MQPTASKTSLLLECSYPFGPEVESSIPAAEPTQAMRYGSAFHEAMAQILTDKDSVSFDRLATKWGVNGDLDVSELAGHVQQAASHLAHWLAGDNPFKINFTENVEFQIEASYAVRAGRRVTLDEASHTYEGLDSTDIGGTVDLAILHKPTNTCLVLDYKTGKSEDFSRPETNKQLLTLALPFAFNGWNIIVGILHTPRFGLPAMYAERIARTNLFDHALKLSTALDKRGDGSMRPGAWCSRCPALSACPTNSGRLLDEAGTLVEKAALVGSELALVNSGEIISREEKLGRLHLLLTRFRELDKRAIDEIKAAMTADANLVPFRPDGKQLMLKEKTSESLSKSSILRALGKEEGEKMVAKLRELGCIETVARTELHAK